MQQNKLTHFKAQQASDLRVPKTLFHHLSLEWGTTAAWQNCIACVCFFCWQAKYQVSPNTIMLQNVWVTQSSISVKLVFLLISLSLHFKSLIWHLELNNMYFHIYIGYLHDKKSIGLVQKACFCTSFSGCKLSGRETQSVFWTIVFLFVHLLCHLRSNCGRLSILLILSAVFHHHT